MGDIDLTGHRKPISHYRSLLWNGGSAYLAVREPDGYRGQVKTTMWSTWPTTASWTWPGWEGKPIEVEVYSRAPKVRLYLNGELQGEAPTHEMKAVFTLPYQPGLLRAEAGDDRCELQTAGEAVALRLTADRQSLPSDGQSLAYITIEAIDTEGRVVPTCSEALTLCVTGGGDFLAAGNGDIKDEDPYFDNRHHLWQGRALAVLRSNGRHSKTTLCVKGKTLPEVRLVLK